MKRVRIIDRVMKTDERGWFLKVIHGTEADLPQHTGEVYLTLALPGQVRGGHYHRIAREWFTVVQGTAEVVLQDVETGERETILLTDRDPKTLYVPPGVAHAFTCPADVQTPMLLVAYSDVLYDPADTLPFHVTEPASAGSVS